MRKLFEIKEDIANLMELDADRYVNGETGEIINQQQFDALQMEYADKVEGVALGVKRERAMAEAIDKEIKELKERKAYHEKREEGYKGFLARELIDRKFETAKVKISWRKSDPVVITDITKLSKYYLKDRRLTEDDFNKTMIKADIKKGVTIDGAQIVSKNNIQVK